MKILYLLRGLIPLIHQRFGAQLQQIQGSQCDSLYRATPSLILCSILLLQSVVLSSCSPSTGGSVSDDTSKPVAYYLSPKADEDSVPLNSKVIIKFNEALNPESVASDAVSVAAIDPNSGSASSGSVVKGSTVYIENGGEYVVVFTPDSDLKPNTLYRVIISSAISDLSGNYGYLYEYRFTTGDKVTNDIVPPTVVSTVPSKGQTGVAVNRAIVVNFDEQIEPSTIDGNSFYLQKTNDTTKVVATVSYANGSATLKPASDLSPSTSYTATVTAMISDLAGNNMVADYQWTFTTGAANNGDTTPPIVSLVKPAANAINVSITSVLSATFNEAISSATINSSSFTLETAGVAVNGVVAYNGTTATFTPTSALALNTVYKATLTTAIKDLAGNALAANYSWSFTTETVGNNDTTPPMVAAVSPTIGALDVATNSAISAQFSEAIDPATINNTTFTLVDTINGNGSVVSASVNYDGTSAILKPLANLLDNTLYTATLTTGVKDLAGNSLTANYAWTFRTVAAPDTTPPTVVLTNPANGAIDVVTNTAISAVFSEALNAGTVNTTSFLLTRQSDGSAINGAVNYSALTATFTPAVALDVNTTYVAYLTTGISDLAGNALAQTFTWNFKTAAATDTTPPTLVSLSPPRGATGVAVTINAISATFSEPLDPNTVSVNNNVTLTNTATGALVAGSVSYANNTITFSPIGNLAFGTTYRATISQAVTDLAGNPLTQDIIWSFTTVLARGGGGGMGGGGGG